MTTATLPLALAIGAFAVMTSNAQAAQLDQVQIDPPVVKVLGRDPGTYAPIEKITVVARVIPDPETLTTRLGCRAVERLHPRSCSQGLLRGQPAGAR